MAETIMEAPPSAGINTPSLAGLDNNDNIPKASSAVPAVVDEITPAWLSDVLGIKVKSIEKTGELPGTASKVFVKADTEAGEKRLCIKGGFNPDFIKQVPWIVMIYQREVEFFNRIAPLLEHITLPKSWWAGQGVVVMDDLAAQGCDFGNPLWPWGVNRVRAGVEQLAALHARTWGVQPADYPWLTSDYDQAILTLMQTYEAVVNGADRPSVPAYIRDQARMTEVLKKHYRLRNPKFQCLLHGDAHLGNTYVEGDAPRFLDWQMIHIGSSLHDVAYFVCGALTVEDRRAHEWEILDHYLATLAQLGVPGPLTSSDEDVRNEYRKSVLAGVGPIMCPYEMQPREWVHTMAVRYATALDDHKVLELVESLPEPATS